jgi:hypothetical protein
MNSKVKEQKINIDLPVSKSWIGNKCQQVTQLLVITLMMPILLSSCAIYSAGFNCPDSQGARCMMLSEVDKRVDSGEIETVYLPKKCRGKSCKLESGNALQNNVPQKALNQIHKVKIMPAPDETSEYQDGDNLYLQ